RLLSRKRFTSTTGLGAHGLESRSSRAENYWIPCNLPPNRSTVPYGADVAKRSVRSTERAVHLWVEGVRGIGNLLAVVRNREHDHLQPRNNRVNGEVRCATKTQTHLRQYWCRRHFLR